MVKIALQLKATLENIQELSPADEFFRWYLKFTCNSCGNVSEKWNYVTLSESTPTQRGNAVNHFTNKCKFCSRENSLTIIEDSTKSYTAEDQGKFRSVVAFDCRGLEPNNFSPRNGWRAKAVENGKEFLDVDLTEGEWVDYCDKTNQPVSIMNIEHNFARIK